MKKSEILIVCILLTMIVITVQMKNKVEAMNEITNMHLEMIRQKEQEIQNLSNRLDDIIITNEALMRGIGKGKLDLVYKHKEMLKEIYNVDG